MQRPYPLTQRAARGALALLLALLAANSGSAQTSTQREAPASVTGRVRDGERGLPGAAVVLMSVEPSQGYRTAARAKTDAEGRYQMTNVPPGRYQITPVAPAYVVQSMSDSWPPGRPLTLLAGEEVSDVDFRVERGGVITGRVTDADGNPVVAESVSVMPADEKTPNVQHAAYERGDISTDDRGIYRIYGLPAGRYHVSVGMGGDGRGAVSYGRRRMFRRTFYPDATEPSQARVIELRPGDEATDIDITLGRPLKTYRASGRIVSAETGRPVPNLFFGYGALDPSGKSISSFGGGQATNALGEFQTEGLAPGRYAVFAMPQEGSEFYSDFTFFDVSDADVTGIVVQAKRGATVSGFVRVEGVADRAEAARLLSQVRVEAFIETQGQRGGGVPSFIRPSPVAPDGSFRIVGVRPGNLRVSASTPMAGLTLARVELNGAPAAGGIPITEGAQVTGVRVVLNYGSGVIRGQASFINGKLPQGARVFALAHGANAPDGVGWHQAEVDVRGFFRIEGLAAGEYELTVRVFTDGFGVSSEQQRVAVADGAEVNVSPVVDLGRLNTRPAPPRVPQANP